MTFSSRAFGTTLFAIAVSVLAMNTRPAIAQPDINIQPSLVYTYARYYAPYAIQARAAYLPINELDDKRNKWDAQGYGADVNYTIQSAFTDPIVQQRAREAFKHWRYQFGSESYLTCYDPADIACQEAYRLRGWWPFSTGPAFQVWTRTRFPATGREACSEVSIAFRGTVGGGADWSSNFDRFGSPLDDYYHQLRRNIDGILSAITKLDCYKRAGRPQIVSTGHSLGGGLAQLAALANRTNGPRIAKVFAFDPSPVTGAHLVRPPLLGQNSAGLTIDRIYEAGEILAFARAAAEEYPSTRSACNPMVRTVKVAAASRGNAIQLHAMSLLAGQIVQLSYNGETPLAYATPPSPANCNFRYRAPATDQDDVVVSDSGERRTRVASARTQRRAMSRLADRSLPAARPFEAPVRAANAWANSPLFAAE
jgi:lipase (class 3)